MDKTPIYGFNRPDFKDEADIRVITENADLTELALNNHEQGSNPHPNALLAKLSEEGATNWDSGNFDPNEKADKNSLETTSFSLADGLIFNSSNQIWKNQFGEVGFTLGVYDSNNGNWGSKVIATIPVGFRPKTISITSCQVELGFSSGALSFQPDGKVILFTDDTSVRYVRASGGWVIK